MGVAIRAYSNTKQIHKYTLDEYGFVETPNGAICVKKSLCDWPQLGVLEDNGVYTYDDYFCEFRMSCGVYVLLRDEMCRIMGYKKSNHMSKILGHVPHYAALIENVKENDYGSVLSELLYHSDCDGFIDAATCRKIHDDLLFFRDHMCTSDDEYVLFHVKTLITTFEFASNGFVQIS